MDQVSAAPVLRNAPVVDRWTEASTVVSIPQSGGGHSESLPQPRGEADLTSAAD